MEHRAKIIGIALLCLAFGSEALTLGRLSGAAWVGRSLDITIPVQMSAGEDAASLCFKADVFHADTRQDPTLVRVAIEPSTQADTATIRVTSLAPVNEPVVTVYVRTECGQKTTRRYVMLADMPSEVSAAPVLPVVATPVRVAPLIVESSLPSVASQPGADSGSAVAKPARKRIKTSSLPREVSRNKARPKAIAEPAATRPRLKLNPLDFLPDRIADIEAYGPAAASEEALRTMQRMKALEDSVASLMALNAKNEASLLELNARLKKAESNQYPDEVLYGLAVLLLACLAALALLWQRQRNSSQSGDNWWAASASEPDEPATIHTPVIPAVVSPARQGKNAVAAAIDSGRPSEFFGHSDSAHAVDVNLMEMSESGFHDLMQIGPKASVEKAAQPAPKPVTATHPAVDHGIDTDPLHDLLTQAEFFLSMGQAEQASRLLTRQIMEGSQPNPFVYLHLLSVLHTHGERANFEQISHDFGALFNCRVPEFSIFKNEGRSLENYPTVLAAITAVWPKPESVQLLEACLVRGPGDARGHPYDMAAFRDLALLHAVAKNINQAPKAALNDFDNHLPTAPAELDVAPLDLPLDDMEYAGGLDIDLDIDLHDSRMQELGIAHTKGPGAHFPAVTPAAEDDSADAQWLAASAIPDDGNLIDFELPSKTTSIQPAAKKPPK